jgi:Multiubiquitin
LDAKTRTKAITISVNNREVTLGDREATGAQIKDAAGVPADFQLFLEHGNRLEAIGDDQILKLHKHQSFRAVSGQDVS